MNVVRLSLLVSYLLFANVSQVLTQSDEQCKSVQDEFMKVIGVDIDSAIVIANTLINYDEGVPYCRLIGHSNLVISYILNVEEDSIFHHYDLIMSDPELADYPDIKQRTIVTLASYYVNNGMGDKAIEFLKPKLEERDWAPRYFVSGCMKISLAHANNFENDSSIIYLKMADSVAMKSEIDHLTKGELFAVFGLTYQKLMKHEESLEYYKKCLVEYNANDFSRNFSYYYNNMANCAIKLGRFDEAQSFLDSAQNYINYLPSFQGAIYWTEAFLKQETNQYADAIEANERVIEYYAESKTVNGNLYVYNAIKDVLHSKLSLGHLEGYSAYINKIDPEIVDNFSLKDSFHFQNYKRIEKLASKDIVMARQEIENTHLAYRYIFNIRESALSEDLEKYQSRKKADSIKILTLINNENSLAIKNRNNLLWGGSLLLLLLGSLVVFYRKFLRAQREVNVLTQHEKLLLEEKRAKLALENAQLVFDKSDLERINMGLMDSIKKQELNENKEDTVLEIKTKGKKHIIKGSDLLFIKAEEAGSRYFLSNGNSLWDDQKLKFWANQLDVNYFPRIHKSYLVNKEYIGWVNYNKLSLKDGAEIPIGRAYKDNLT